MPRFTPDPNRLNTTVSQTGREFNLRLQQRGQAIFTTLLNLLPSTYISAIQGPNYTLELKAVAVELARIELALEDVNTDSSVDTTRPDFLYSIVGYLLFLNGRLPPMDFSDEEFRQFVINLIRIYFQGSTPKSISDLTKLLLSGDVRVTENFLLVRQGASGLDISDQFGFNVDVVIPVGGQLPTNMFQVDATLRMLLDIIRPAHTLFKIRYIFQDPIIPNGDTTGTIIDSMRWALANYYYEDFRSYWGGVRNRDRLGMKQNQAVSAEDHSKDF
jgi:hypothetical protein